MNSRVAGGWALLYLSPQNQSRYTEYLDEYYPDVEVYAPVYQRLSRPHRSRKVVLVTKPVYPGYMFARVDINGTEVHGLLSSPLRVRFIKFGGLISVVPDRIIAELKKLETAKLLVTEKVVDNPYLPGRKVLVHFPTIDIRGVIVRLMAGGSRVLIDTQLGRAVVGVHNAEPL